MPASTRTNVERDRKLSRNSGAVSSVASLARFASRLHDVRSQLEQTHRPWTLPRGRRAVGARQPSGNRSCRVFVKVRTRSREQVDTAPCTFDPRDTRHCDGGRTHDGRCRLRLRRSICSCRGPDKLSSRRSCCHRTPKVAGSIPSRRCSHSLRRTRSSRFAGLQRPRRRSSSSTRRLPASWPRNRSPRSRSACRSSRRRQRFAPPPPSRPAPAGRPRREGDRRDRLPKRHLLRRYRHRKTRSVPSQQRRAARRRTVRREL
jgi:hypothetical protein